MSNPSPALMGVLELKALANAGGRAFAGVFAVKRLNTRTASNGNTFLTVELGDRGGSFGCTVFGDSPIFETLNGAGEGRVIRVEGKVDYYQSRLSPKLSKAEILTDEQLKAPGLIDNLVESSPEDPAVLWKDFQGFIASIGNEGLRLTVNHVFEEIGEAFRFSPAAIGMHHAYRHGLLEHTVHMARVCSALLPIYPEVDGDLAMAGVLLHDIGKVIEYEGTLSTKRSRKGILQGHVVLGYQLVRKAGLKAKVDADRLERLEHIILSHQGEPEWGAAIYAATPEAVFVSKIDDLDARMGMVQRTLRKAAEGEEFSEKHPGLNTQLLTRPPSA